MSSIRASQSISTHPRRTCRPLSDHHNSSVELIVVLRDLRAEQDHSHGQSICADLRYSITHEDPYAMPFFANRPGLTASAMPSITVHVDLEPPLRVRPIKRAANPPCILGPDSLVYQPRTNNQVNESTWSRHRPFTPRDRTPSVKLQSCHAVHASMCTGPNTQPGNRGVVV